MGVSKRGPIGVLLVLLLPLFAAGVDASCLLYPQDERFYCVDPTSIEGDCGPEGCDQYTTPADCSSEPKCVPVTCNIDCSDHTSGFCEELGGQAVEDEFQECGPACCQIERTNSCSLTATKFACDKKAIDFGLRVTDSFFDTSETDANRCAARCGNAVEQPQPQDQPTGTATISVTIPQIDDATISYVGPARGTVRANANPHQIEDLPAGTYTVTASRVGYLSASAQVILVDGETKEITLTLTQQSSKGITGQTFIDLDGDGNENQETEKAPGTKIFINGAFKGISSLTANFRIDLPTLESGIEHQITAKTVINNVEYEFSDTFTIEDDEPLTLNLLLTRKIAECGPDGAAKNVDEFTANHIPGQKAVRLSWLKPCREVQSYEITREPEGLTQTKFSAAEGTFVDDQVEWDQLYTYQIVAVYEGSAGSTRESEAPVQVEIKLGNAQCENKYNPTTSWDQFCIANDPDTAPDERKSYFTCDNTNTLVPQPCPPDSVRSKATYFCAPTSAHTAACKNDGPCSIRDDNPFSMYYTRSICLGTSSSSQDQIENFCNYDYSKTIVDTCSSCTRVTSCFDYNGKNACETNSCLTTKCNWIDSASNKKSLEEPDTPLINYDLLFSGLDEDILLPTTTSQETGAGYCAPDKYKQDDQCNLCSDKSSLFENYYCTAQVCSGLGRCFSNPPGIFGPALTSCVSCGETTTPDINCYSYTTQLECAGSMQPQSLGISKNDQHQLSLSTDQCSWKRCRWVPTDQGKGQCIKDGDADNIGDCDALVVGDRDACYADSLPPKTEILAQDLSIISTKITDITFHSVDTKDILGASSPLGSLYHCLVPTDDPAGICTAFTEVPFTGRLSDETLPINLLQEFNEEIEGATYRLIYFAKDKYFNQEEPHSDLVFVDNVAPDFEIKKESTTLADTSTLIITLNPLRPETGDTSCRFNLTQLLPLGSSDIRDVTEEPKTITYENLQGISYNLAVTCVDQYGNENTKSDFIVLNPDQTIEIISPTIDQVLERNVVTFQLHTTVGTFCKLFDGENQITDFATNEEGKDHSSPEITLPADVTPASHRYGSYSANCRDFLTGEEHLAAFAFTVDTLAPRTTITLTEGEREITKTRADWEEFFIRSATLSFECSADGFPCAGTQFCVGEPCEFKPFESAVTIEQSNKVCYFSTDSANHNEVPKCGTIKIEGFGITLELPPLHHYNDQMWGVSATPVFPWQFNTRVPAVECRYDFTSNFDYEDLPPFKTILPNIQQKYLVSEFPTASGVAAYPEDGGLKSVFVQCKNNEEELSPVQKMTLEYDPTAPAILEAIAIPSLLLEGPSVLLQVKTDDKTLCKFSDQGHEFYDQMNHQFSGADDAILNETHTTVFFVNTFNGLTKDFALNVQCRNGAGTPSEVASIVFSVDYSALGSIDFISPSGGYFTQETLPLEVHTSKSAVCEFERNETYFGLEGAGTTQHHVQLENLEERDHRYPIRCQMGDHITEGLSTFTIDRTPPRIISINDGNLSCGKNPLHVLATSNDEAVVSYYYEIYDLGEERVINRTLNRNVTLSGGDLVLSATIPPTTPIVIPTESFNATHRYYVKLKATDAAGLTGEFNVSDGVLIVNQNHTTCLEDKTPPVVTPTINQTCAKATAELSCEDTVGCFNLTATQAPSAAACKANVSYTGQKFLFTTSGVLCYKVQDNVGNNISGVFPITFNDADGDGVGDKCDNCSTTPAGAISGQTGCSHVDPPPTTKDTDLDGLPDEWEKKHNSCGLDHLKADSDGNNVRDGDEDQDNDDRTNLEEFIDGTNPCTKDEKPKQDDDKDNDGIKDSEDNCPNIFNPDQEDSDDDGRGDACDTTETPPVTPPVTPPNNQKDNLLPLGLIALGLLLFIGGTAYLVSYYKRSSKGKQPSNDNASDEPGLLDSIADKIPLFKRSGKQKVRARETAFAAFHEKSAEIPHVGSLISRSSSLPKLHEVAHTYLEHKDEIKPGLRPQEKSVFNELEKIAKKTTDTPINKVVEKDKAKEIFSKLKEITQNRKKGK